MKYRASIIDMVIYLLAVPVGVCVMILDSVALACSLLGLYMLLILLRMKELRKICKRAEWRCKNDIT